MAKPKNKDKKRKKKTQASTADRYELYLQSVQSPDVDAKFIRRAYKKTYGDAPKVLREDFCGTFAVCCEWAKFGPDYYAWGVDLDPDPLAWGREHNLALLKGDARDRVRVVEGDVRTAVTPKADAIAAENFSYCIFKTRDALREYFASAHRHLNERGVIVCDLFGGYESIEDDREEETEYSGFTYIWDQAKFNPITHDGLYHIHFAFPDGRKIRKAFSYDWRLWSIPEVREVMVEAGFTRADVYWEGTDEKTGDGTGKFSKSELGDSDPAWNAYIVGVK